MAASIDDVLAQERPRLVALAYRMLGSMADAEDVVHDAVLRTRAAAPSDLVSPGAYLTTATTRAAIDHLRSARVRRERYVGPWLPEPVMADPIGDPAAAAELADSLSMAFLVVLESLTPAERAALLLHDVFGVPHAQVADALGVSAAASRQLVHRARQHLEARRPRFDVDRARHAELVERFTAACNGASIDEFVELLAADATYVADGGASTKAARHPIVGVARVSRFMAYVYGRPSRSRSAQGIVLNGAPAIAIHVRGRVDTVLFVEPGADGRASTIYAVRNPDKLAGVQG